jgi:hypothetical protein
MEFLVNRPVIINKNKTDESCLLSDVVIPSERNLIQKEVEVKLNYKNLSTEIEQVWNMKRFVIPVITGATGIVTKGLRSSGSIQQGLYKKKKKNSCTRNIAHNKEVLQSET